MSATAASSTAFAPYSRFQTRALWNILRNVQTCEEKYRVLKTLCLRLQNCTDQNSIITPDALQGLKNLLGDEENEEPMIIKLMTLKVIRILANNTDMRIVLVRQGIILSLVYVLEGCRSVCQGEAQLELLREVCNLLIKLVESSFINHKQVLEYAGLQELTRLLHPHKSPLYDFSPEGRLYAQDHMPGQTLSGVVANLASDELSDLYRTVIPNPDGLWMPKIGYSVTNCGKCDELKKLNHIWDKTSPLDEVPEKPVDDSNRCDIFVTHVINPVLFWGLMGHKSLDAVQNVESILRQWPEEEKDMLTRVPKVRSFVCGHESDLGFFRGQVISVCDDNLEIIALDYGRVVKCNWEGLFLLSPAIVEKLKPYPPQVTLCTFQDVTPPPLDRSLMELMLQTVTTLVSSANIIELQFKKSHLQVLLLLLKCPEPSLRAGAADILANVAHSEVLREKIVAHGALQTLLELVGKYTYSSTDRASMEATASCLIAVANMMHLQQENRILFAQHPNLLTTVITLCRRSLPVVLQSAALKVLRIFTGNANPLNINQDQGRGRAMRSRSVGGRVDGWSPDRPLGRGRPQGRQCNSDTEPRLMRDKSRERRRVEASLSSMRLNQDFDDDTVDIRTRVPYVSSGLETDEGIMKKRSRSLPNEVIHVSGAAAYDNHVPVEATEDYLASKVQKTYKWGDKVDLCDSETCALLAFENLADIKRKMMSQILVSMLNTGKPGMIHIGILPSGLVKGLKIDRDNRDEFRLGVDAEMGRVQPNVMYPQYHVAFCPVLVGNGDSSAVVKQDFYVIEISLKPVAGTLYTPPTGECYIRQGTDIYKLTLQDMHEQAVITEEAKYAKEIKSLELEVRRLREDYQQKKLQMPA